MSTALLPGIPDEQTEPNSNLFICSINAVNLSTDQILTYQHPSGCRSL